MATPEDEKNERQRLDQALAKLAEITPESLVRREELGAALSFESGAPYFSRTLKLFRDLANCSLDGLPHAALRPLADVATDALTRFEAIRSFSIEKYPQNSIQQRDTFINEIRDYHDTVYQVVTPHIAYSVRKGTDFEALEREARETLKNIKSVQEDQIRSQKALEGEVNAIVESIRRAAAEVGVAQHSIHFKGESDYHAKASLRWLIATVGIAVATLGFGGYTVWYYSTLSTPLDSGQSIQIAVAKIIIFTVLYFAMIWGGRNYRAHRHNYVVNKHRQNALSTFEAFVKAATDDQTKNAVLLQSTQAIFAPQVSGYLGKETEGQPSSQVLEIIRGAVSRDKG